MKLLSNKLQIFLSIFFGIFVSIFLKSFFSAHINIYVYCFVAMGMFLGLLQKQWLIGSLYIVFGIILSIEADYINVVFIVFRMMVFISVALLLMKHYNNRTIRILLTVSCILFIIRTVYALIPNDLVFNLFKPTNYKQTVHLLNLINLVKQLVCELSYVFMIIANIIGTVKYLKINKSIDKQ